MKTLTTYLNSPSYEMKRYALTPNHCPIALLIMGLYVSTFMVLSIVNSNWYKDRTGEASFQIQTGIE